VTRVDTKTLRDRAEAATAGPWFGPRLTDAGPPGEWGVYAADDHGAPIPGAIVASMPRLEGGDSGEQCANATFIAAAHPRAILDLIDEVDGARAPEAHWECQQKIDTLEEKLVTLTRALAEALDLFDAVWCPEHGHAPQPAQLSRAEELRKLVSA
jgi:Ead/Ea22-like protein